MKTEKAIYNINEIEKCFKELKAIQKPCKINQYFNYFIEFKKVFENHEKAMSPNNYDWIIDKNYIEVGIKKGYNFKNYTKKELDRCLKDLLLHTSDSFKLIYQMVLENEVEG